MDHSNIFRSKTPPPPSQLAPQFVDAVADGLGFGEDDTDLRQALHTCFKASSFCFY